ncbi:MAG: hypothetical protein KDD72_00815 [Anaerolineales bacterium]|nr:hypothetical protein [Anaerolineales bacterium]
MDSLTLFKMGFLITISLLRLAVVIPLFQTARRNNLVNLYWLGAQFLALVIAVPFAAVGAWDNRWIFWTFISLSEIALLMFIHTTFRRGRSSAMPVLMTLAVIGLFGGAYGTITNNFELSAWMVYPNAIFAWGWHFGEASRSYRNIVKDSSTEDWVKSRYVLMIIYSTIDLSGATLGTILTTSIWVSDAASFLVVVINFVSVIFQILTWVMPERFRLWLNRNQQARTEERIHEQAMSILDILADAMIEGTETPKMLMMFALRKTIGQNIKSEDEKLVETQAVSMGYMEWLNLLRDPELYILVKNSGNTTDPRSALARAENALIRKQSLFTMRAK